jgi:Zn finger protein HypA/HybF involved in hydrogenase expression
MKRGFMDDSAGGAASPSAFACPHCGAEEVRWYQDACVRYDVLNVEDGLVLVDGATLTVIRYEKGEFACGNCQRRVHLDESDLQFKRPTLELNREALDRGFVASRGDRSAARLSLLPGGVFESFGEFAEGVVSAARYDWGAITGPGSTSVRLQPLFPYGEQILPIVTVGEAESASFAGKAVSRKDLGESHGHGLMVGDLTAAAVLCGFAVDAANEVLERPEVVAEITE